MDIITSQLDALTTTEIVLGSVAGLIFLVIAYKIYKNTCGWVQDIFCIVCFIMLMFIIIIIGIAIKSLQDTRMGYLAQLLPTIP